MSRGGWKEVVLGDLAIVIDSKHKTPKYSNNGLPMVRAVDINGAKLDLSNTKKVSQAVYNDFAKGRDPQIGDLIISRVGHYLGKVSFVASEKKFCMGQNIALIIPKYNNLFLYYFLTSSLGRKQIDLFKVGAAQPTISLKSINNLPINLPPLPTQKAIAKILGDLDAKIELNRKMNESLEAMAQAVFQSWFVDFDPVLDNFLAKNGGNVAALPEPLRKKGALRLAVTKKNTPEINKLFPDSFVFNEVLEKWIPEGWGDVKLNEIAEVKYGKDHKKLPEGKFPCYGSGGVMRYVDSTLYEDHSVLIPRKGTLSNLMYIRNPFWSVDTMFYTTFKEASHVKFLYYNLKRLNLSEMNVGSAVPSMTTGVLNDLKFIFPSEKNIKRFDFELENLYLKIASNKSQTQSLTKLRDTLLPQLISGKLSVPEAMLGVNKEIVS